MLVTASKIYFYFYSLMTESAIGSLAWVLSKCAEIVLDYYIEIDYYMGAMGALAPTTLREKVILSNCRKKLLGIWENSIDAQHPNFHILTTFLKVYLQSWNSSIVSIQIVS